ncbi:hypothetical protein [Terrabacter sp. 2RAF25]|uniref:hypothetical protein n=1 Tax=Terrabacter sp. 2RAF25 TaxID=3232998 RepID=UPI003F9B0EB9
MTSGTSVTSGSRRILVGMTTLSTSPAGLAPRARVVRILRTRFGRFLGAFVEMTVSMVVGMGVLGAVWDGVWPGLTLRPDVMALSMAFDMTAGMAAWMWVRRHSTRHILEMSAVMVLPFLVLLVPFHLGILSGDAVITWGHVAMFVLMAAYLWLRPHAAGAHPALARTDSAARRHASRRGLVAALLLVGGAVLAVVGGLLHPHTEAPNSHVAVFAEYAESTDWVWVHDLQFLSAAVVAAGFVVVGGALVRAGAPSVLARLGNTAAAATVALIAVNMAVDGVALKGAVDAWAVAGPDDKAVRFAAAEAIRWLEWGVNSFFTLLLGVTVVIFAVALLRSAHHSTLTRLAGVSGALAGVLLVLNGLVVGTRGFEPSALPKVATLLYVVMALGLPAVDRGARAASDVAVT